MSLEVAAIKGVVGELGIQAMDSTFPIRFSSASALEIGNILMANVSQLSSLGNITLSPSGNISTSNKYIKDSGGFFFNSTSDSAESGLLRG